MIEWWGWLVLVFFLFFIGEGLVCGFCQYRARYGPLSARQPNDDPHNVGNVHVSGGPHQSDDQQMKPIPSSVTSPRSGSPSNTNATTNHLQAQHGPPVVGAGAGSWGLLGGRTSSSNPQKITVIDGLPTTSGGSGGGGTRFGRDPFIDDLDLYRPNTDAVGGGQGGLRAAGASARVVSKPPPAYHVPTPSHQLGATGNGPLGGGYNQLGQRRRPVTIADADSEDGDYGDSFVDSVSKLDGAHRINSNASSIGGGGAGPGGTGLLPAPPTLERDNNHRDPSGPIQLPPQSVLNPTATATTTNPSSAASIPTTVTMDGKVLTEDEVMDAL